MRQNWWKGKLALFWMLASWGRVDSCPKADPLHWQSVGKSFYSLREGAPCRNSTVSSGRHPETGHAVVWSALPWLETVDLQVRDQSVSFSWGHFSALWQRMSWLPPDHHAVSFLAWWRFQYLQESAQDMAQKSIYSLWEGTRGSWLDLMTKLVLFGLLWLSSFLKVLTSLIQLILWLTFSHIRKAGREQEGQGA